MRIGQRIRKYPHQELHPDLNFRKIAPCLLGHGGEKLYPRVALGFQDYETCVFLRGPIEHALMPTTRAVGLHVSSAADR